MKIRLLGVLVGILVHEGDTWKIRKDTVSFYNPWGTN
jgi:hypothetical protein